MFRKVFSHLCIYPIVFYIGLVLMREGAFGVEPSCWGSACLEGRPQDVEAGGGELTTGAAVAGQRGQERHGEDHDCDGGGGVAGHHEALADGGAQARGRIEDGGGDNWQRAGGVAGAGASQTVRSFDGFLLVS